MFNSHNGNQDFFLLANGVYHVVIIKKPPICNGNSSIMDPIAKLDAAYAFEHECVKVCSQSMYTKLWS